MKNACLVALTVLALMFAYVAIHCVPAPTQLSQQKKEAIQKEIAEKTEWSGHGNEITATYPILEISKNNPRIRLVQSTTWTNERGYSSELTSIYPELSFRWRLEPGKYLGQQELKSKE